MNQKRRTLDIVAVGRHVEAASRRRRAGVAALGAALVVGAFVPRGVVGAAMALVGATLLARGVTGRPLAITAKRLAGELGSRAARDRRDQVDEASWESFPASDPPAHSSSRG